MYTTMALRYSSSHQYDYSRLEGYGAQQLMAITVLQETGKSKKYPMRSSDCSADMHSQFFRPMALVFTLWIHG